MVRYENEVDELETRELELMETADDLRSRITDAAQKLAKTQGLVDEEIAELQARLDDRKAGLTETNTTREDLVTQVDDEDLLDTYNRLNHKTESQADVRDTSERS